MLLDPSEIKQISESRAGIDCGDDPIAGLKEMFVEIVSGRRIESGQSPALRPVFLIPHGVALGDFEIRGDLPTEYRVGIFQNERFPVAVRFSSDTLPQRPDARSTIGIGIKLIGVPGKKLLFEDAVTCDFLMQNHNVFFVDTAKDMCQFTRAGVIDGSYDEYLAAHPRTKQILDEMAKISSSALKESYWGLMPLRFGPDRHVKYKLAA